MRAVDDKPMSLQLRFGVPVVWALTIVLAVRCLCDLLAWMAFSAWTTVVLGIGGWLWFRTSKSGRRLILIAALSGVPAWSAVQFYEGHRARMQQEEIRAALERFYLAHGSYPGDLQLLRPSYIPEIPTAVIAFRRLEPTYTLEDSGAYRLRYGEEDCGVTYRSPAH